MKKYIKRNIKVLIAFLIGLLIAGTTVYATTVLSGSDVSYSNESSKLTSTNVQGAIDEMYNKIKNNTFEMNTAKTIYATSKGVCIERNGKLDCFKINNFDVEKEHIQQVFSDISCDVGLSGVDCYASDFSCVVDSYGYVGCIDESDRSGCGGNLDNSVSCN